MGVDGRLVCTGTKAVAPGASRSRPDPSTATPSRLPSAIITVHSALAAGPVTLVLVQLLALSLEIITRVVASSPPSPGSPMGVPSGGPLRRTILEPRTCDRTNSIQGRASGVECQDLP